MLSTTVSNPQPRRKSAALEHMLDNLETAGDLLSGSECSSLATSPVHEEAFTFELQSSEQQQHELNEVSRLGLKNPEPVDIVRNFLSCMSEPDVARGFVAEDAKVESHSVMAGGEHKRRGTTSRAAHDDLDELLASCSRCDIRIDSIFACGENVAAFGHLAYLDSPSGLAKNAHFSVWACVDVARGKIVGLRWLDQIARAEDNCMSRH